MARMIISESALSDLKRLIEFLREKDQEVAFKAGATIEAYIAHLKDYPEAVQVIQDDFRIQTVPFGKKGYSVAYVYNHEADTVIVYGVKHQMENFFPFELEPGVDEDEKHSCK